MITVVDGDLPADWFIAATERRYVGMDIETSGLDRVSDKIACVQLYIPDYGSIMVRNLYNPELICGLLEKTSTTKIFHHAGFDLSFLMRDYDIMPQRIACTKIAVKVLDPKRSQYKSHSLKELVFQEFGYVMDKTLSISDWFAPVLSEAQLQYGMDDVRYLPALLAVLEGQLAKSGKLSKARAAYQYLPAKIALEVRHGIPDGNVFGY